MDVVRRSLEELRRGNDEFDRLVQERIGLVAERRVLLKELARLRMLPLYFTEVVRPREASFPPEILRDVDLRPRPTKE